MEPIFLSQSPSPLYEREVNLKTSHKSSHLSSLSAGSITMNTGSISRSISGRVLRRTRSLNSEPNPYLNATKVADMTMPAHPLSLEMAKIEEGKLSEKPEYKNSKAEPLIEEVVTRKRSLSKQSCFREAQIKALMNHHRRLELAKQADQLGAKNKEVEHQVVKIHKDKLEQQLGENKGLLFVRNICYFERIVAEEEYKEHIPGEILDKLHENNYITLLEAALGYKAVMTTAQFIENLRQHFYEVDDRVRKYDCILAFKEWFKFRKFYLPEFKDADTVHAIQSFIALAEKEFGKPFFQKIKREIKQIVQKAGLYSGMYQAGQNLTFYGFSAFVEHYKEDPNGLAEELYCLTVALQAEIKSNIFEKNNNGTNLQISRIFNSLTKCIKLDLENTVANERINKLIFYVSVAKAAIHQKGDFLTSLAFTGVFESKKFSLLFGESKEIKKLKPEMNEIKRIAFEGSSKVIRNQMLEDKKTPLHFFHFFYEIEALKDKVPPIIEIGGQKQFSAHYISAIAMLAWDILKRQECTAEFQSKTNIYQLLELNWEWRNTERAFKKNSRSTP